MDKMKARVLKSVGNLEYCDYPLPTLKPDEVLFRVKACGICGSDIPRIFVNGTYHFPTIPGHEFSGEVAAVADDKYKDLVGMRATVFPLIPCMIPPVKSKRRLSVTRKTKLLSHDEG